MNRPETRAEWAKLGAAGMTMAPDAFAKYVADDSRSGTG